MRRLHLKFYLAIVGTLIVFLATGAMIWHHFSSPMAAMTGIESSAGFAARMLDDPKNAARQQEILDALATHLHAEGALYDSGGIPRFVAGHPRPLTPEEIATRGWLLRHGGPTLNYELEQGRHLVVQPRHRFLWHSVHLGLMLTFVAAVLALLIYPITRGITARLARLESGVQQFGAGDLTVRVKVEGRDEVASLAKSFNESADRVEQLVRAHQLLLANCSHELRTPLARIRMAVDRVPGTDPAVIAELARNIAELDALIGEMLLASRLDVAQGIEHPESVDLLALAAEEAAHFDLQVSGDAVTLMADPALLRRLVRNLLENARIHAGGASDLRIETTDRHATIVVDDAGAGVPAADRDRIFEPFRRASNSTRSTGAGLGLSIVRQIARAHGGTVEYSARPEGGSRFTVTLPR